MTYLCYIQYGYAVVEGFEILYCGNDLDIATAYGAEYSESDWNTTVCVESWKDGKLVAGFCWKLLEGIESKTHYQI